MITEPIKMTKIKISSTKYYNFKKENILLKFKLNVECFPLQIKSFVTKK